MAATTKFNVSVKEDTPLLGCFCFYSAVFIARFNISFITNHILE
ncbi:hypothetical protein AOR13_1590 [Alteromonas stellipolaris LMG 21856]|nr:hypothetical protein AOR13_1590 [Alteromonas stellipolaris LMG 21856]